MFITSRRRIGQTGDTVVEVLLAVAVISSVLAGAFILSQRSAIATRDAQEHAVAQKIVETQLESLRAASSDSVESPRIFSENRGFCMDTAQKLSTNACSFSAKGTAAASTDVPAYRVVISRTGCNPAPCGVFTVKVDWDSVTGRGKGNVGMVYRLYGSAP